MKLPRDNVIPLGATYTAGAARLHTDPPEHRDPDSGPEFPLTAAARDFAVLEDDQTRVAVVDDEEPPLEGRTVPDAQHALDPMDPGDAPTAHPDSGEPC